MPDPSACERVAMLERLEHSERKGGIVKYSSKYKGLNVEIRPRRWADRKFWIGQLKNLERAKYVADAVFHYLGKPPFHFEEGVMTLPAITCIGTVIGTPVELSTQEMYANYVGAIAKGRDFRLQRDDFIEKVKNVVMNPAFPFLSPQTEVGVLDERDSDREDEFVFNEDVERALQMSSHSGVPVAVLQTHVAGPDSVGGSEVVQAYVPSFGFDSNDSENILRSAGQSINAIVFSMDDCSTTDEKIWIELIEELNKFTAVGACTPSVASNDGDLCRDETSPVLNFPPNFFDTPVERAVTVGTALGRSSDRPSSQFAMDAKKQKIGD